MGRVGRGLGGVLVVLALILGSAGSSAAVSGGSGSLPNPATDNVPVFPAGVSAARVHAWLVKALSLRLKALSAASVSLTVARNLTVADRTAIDALITRDQSGLTTLFGALATETTISQMVESADAMVTDYRVFSLLVPQVRGVILDDRELVKTTRLAAFEPSIQTAITTEQRTGIRTAAAQRIYQELVGLLSAVATSMGNSATALLALTPQNFAQAGVTLRASAGALAMANSQLITARADISRITRILGGA